VEAIKLDLNLPFFPLVAGKSQSFRASESPFSGNLVSKRRTVAFTSLLVQCIHESFSRCRSVRHNWSPTRFSVSALRAYPIYTNFIRGLSFPMWETKGRCRRGKKALFNRGLAQATAMSTGAYTKVCLYKNLVSSRERISSFFLSPAGTFLFLPHGERRHRFEPRV